jgi:hypothetical protein
MRSGTVLNISTDLGTTAGAVWAYLSCPVDFPVAGSMHFSYGPGVYSADFKETKHSLSGGVDGSYSITDMNKW